MTDYDLTHVVSPVCLLDESAQSAALFTASHSSTLNPGDPCAWMAARCCFTRCLLCGPAGDRSHFYESDVEAEPQ